MKNLIIDTHVHLWDLGSVKYSWLDQDTSILNRTYLPNELVPSLEKAGVSYGVFVQAANNIEDTMLMLEHAAQQEWIRSVVGWLPLQDPKATEKILLDTFIPNNLICGIRHLIHTESDPKWLLQESVIESLRMLKDCGLSYDVVGVNQDHLKTVSQLATKVPGLKLILDHLNQPPQDKAAFNQWGSLMMSLAEFPDIHCKISGLGTTTGKTIWGRDDIAPAIEFVLEHFGAARCLCGGDWPVALLAGPYEKAWQLYQEILHDNLAETDQIKVLSGNAIRLYNLSI